MSKEIPSFSIKELFEEKDSYVIPIYQRNYTWGLGEITQLIQDICDYAFDDEKAKTNYYIGTLVVYERHLEGEITYETIDGQQRLTTLNILLNALHRKFKEQIHTKIEYHLNLTFDSRKKSTETLAVINNHQNSAVSFISNKEYNLNIKQRYFDAEKVLNRSLDTPNKVEKFYSYLTNNVHIVRVSVPEETDLNHYFEIMNNRGEQLEKHEILKANMLEVLKDDKKLSNTFNTVWEACADMERYVQYGFTTKQRDSIFTEGNWNKLNEEIETLDDLANYVYNDSEDKTHKDFTIEEIIAHKGAFEINTGEKEDAPERFNSVINFSNFLLHVLRVQTKSNVSLDDKRLIDAFDVFLKNTDKEKQLQFVKDFGYSLLKTKHLFDQYIIKREFIREKDQWSLKKLKWYSGNKVSYVNVVENDESLNKDVLMLLSMFHVSTPTLVYKHWLNASLYYLFYQTEINANDYKMYLQKLAQSYLFDRYVAKGEPIDYFDIIYENYGVSKNKSILKYDFDKLDNGTDVENFVFNYLDYILWKEGNVNFEFTFRSSVEHYYPQNPISKEHSIDKSIYDLFGNLCLISSSKNSRLSNHMPSAKKDFYYKVGADSLKQQIMMEKDDWAGEEIRIHTEMMKDKLKNFKHA